MRQTGRCALELCSKLQLSKYAFQHCLSTLISLARCGLTNYLVNIKIGWKQRERQRERKREREREREQVKETNCRGGKTGRGWSGSQQGQHAERVGSGHPCPSNTSACMHSHGHTHLHINAHTQDSLMNKKGHLKDRDSSGTGLFNMGGSSAKRKTKCNV